MISICIISLFSFKLTQPEQDLDYVELAEQIIKKLGMCMFPLTAVQDRTFPHKRYKCHTLKIKIKVISYLHVSFTNLTFLNYAIMHTIGVTTS